MTASSSLHHLGRESADGAWSDGHRRFEHVDLLRAVAASLVVVFHVTGSFGPSRDYAWGNGFSRMGNLGVAVFFVLSGFLLSRPFLVNSLLGRPAPDGARYFIRRLARIVPAYWVALTVWLFLVRDQPPLGGYREAVRFYLFLQIYDRDYFLGGGALGVAWSLCVEVTFYLVLPLAAAGLCWLAGSGACDRRVRRMAAICAVAFVIGIALRWWFLSEQLLGAYWLPGHLAWFAGGVGIAAISAGQTAGVTAPAPLRTLAARPLVPVLLGALLFLLTTSLPIAEPTPFRAILIHTSNALTGLLWLIPIVVRPTNRATNHLGRPVLRWIGSVSYGLFLWHAIVLHVVRRWIADGTISGSTAIRFGLVVPISLALAHISWYVIEHPALTAAGRATTASKPPRRQAIEILKATETRP